MIYRYYQIILRVEHFLHKSVLCEVLTGYFIIGASAWRWLGEWIRDIRHNVLQSSFQRESGSSPSYCHIKDAFIWIIINILCVNYIIIIFNNKAVINKNLWNTPRPYCGLQNFHGHAEDFFKIHGQFRHAPSQRFALVKCSHNRRNRSPVCSFIFCSLKT